MNMMLKLHMLVVITVYLRCAMPAVHASNILLVPLAGEGSHLRVMTSIAKELVLRGHSVTLLVEDLYADDLTTSNNPDYKDIKFDFFKHHFTLEDIHSVLQNMTNAGLEGRYLSWFIELMGSDFMTRQVLECQNILGDKKLMSRLLDSNFHLSMVDSGRVCPLVQYLLKHSGIPFVALVPILTLPSASLLGNRVPMNPSYNPDFMSGLDHVMSFSERLKNTITSILFIVLFSISNPYDDMRREYGILDTTPWYDDAELFLINTDFALDFARPLLPNAITVGGLTTGPTQPLKKEWLDFLNSAGEDGVVLFSMGSYATGIDEDVAAMFAGAFAQLPQKVIWKLNGKPSATLTPNVKVVDWIPQNDLLGHSQIKAFVYHCGLNGVWEAVYHGVPMVAVPLFGDQYDNAQRLVSRGMGVKVDISTLTSDELAEAIRTVINDPSYKSNATRISRIFRDSPRTPTEVAADWLEYVIRHGGAKHLRSAALDLNIFQYLLLDVIAVLMVASITFFIILYCSCRLCFRGCRRLCGGSGKVKSE